MKEIIRVEMDEQRMRAWVDEARPVLKSVGRKLRTHRRTLSAEGISTYVWVAVVHFDEPKP